MPIIIVHRHHRPDLKSTRYDVETTNEARARILRVLYINTTITLRRGESAIQIFAPRI